MIYTFKAEFLIDDEEVFTDEKLEEILQYLVDSTSCDIKKCPNSANSGCR